MKEHEDYFKFYPDAWLGDEKLALCRFATKGAWIDLICHMHKCDPYGYLIINGIALDQNDIRKMLRMESQKHFDIVWGELLKYGIIKKDKKTGAFFSKKLLMDYEAKASTHQGAEDETALAMTILEYYNKIVGKKYECQVSNRFMQNVVLNHIGRFPDLETYYKVIEYVYDKWKDSDHMSGFIKPTVIFGQKFPKYVAESMDFKTKGNKEKKKMDFGDSAGFDDFELFKNKG